MVLDAEALLLWSARQRATMSRHGTTPAAVRALESAVSNLEASRASRERSGAVEAAVTLQRWIRSRRRRMAWLELVNDYIGYANLIEELRASRAIRSEEERAEAEHRQSDLKDYVSSRRRSGSSPSPTQSPSPITKPPSPPKSLVEPASPEVEDEDFGA